MFIYNIMLTLRKSLKYNKYIKELINRDVGYIQMHNYDNDYDFLLMYDGLFYNLLRHDNNYFSIIKNNFTYGFYKNNGFLRIYKNQLFDRLKNFRITYNFFIRILFLILILLSLIINILYFFEITNYNYKQFREDTKRELKIYELEK